MEVQPEGLERRALLYLHLEDPTFKTHFRMHRATFEILVNVVQQHKLLMGRTIQRTPIAESILLGLWMIFNKDTFRSTGANFETAPSNDHYPYKNLIHTLCEIGGKYIKWPNAQGRRRIFGFMSEGLDFLEWPL